MYYSNPPGTEYPPQQPPQQTPQWGANGGYPSGPSNVPYNAQPSAAYVPAPAPQGYGEGYYPPSAAPPQPPYAGNTFADPNAGVAGAGYPGYPAPLGAPAAPIGPPPQALNATDENGLRWTWSTYPSAGSTIAAAHPDPSSPTLQPTATSTSTKVLQSATEILSMVSKGGRRKNPYFPMPPDMIIPLSCMFQPLIPLQNSEMCTVPEPPIGLQCTRCGSFCNMHSIRDEGRSWLCLSCLERHNMPNISPHHPVFRCGTVEYVVSPAPPIPQAGATHLNTAAPPVQSTLAHQVGPPSTVAQSMDPLALIFIVDICVSPEELRALQISLLEALQWIAPSTLVGLITAGSTSSVWELSNRCFSRSYTLRGDTPLNYNGHSKALQIKTMESSRGRFLLPLRECHAKLTELLQNLKVDPENVPTPHRPTRTTGTAVAAATYLLEALSPLHNMTNPGSGKAPSKEDTTTPTFAPLPSHQIAANRVPGRLLLFTGGPCTRGGGTVASKEKEHLMRFHRDIMEEDTPYCESATKFYSTLAGRLSYTNACLDVFAQSYDQVGVLEMRSCVDNTGGSMICGDAFEHENFVHSFRRYALRTGICSAELMASCFSRQDQEGQGAIAGEEEMEEWYLDNAGTCGTGVEVQVFTMSGDLHVSGVLGPCVAGSASAAGAGDPSKKEKAVVVQSTVGVGNGSNRWFSSMMQQETSLAFIFDVALDPSSVGAGGTALSRQPQERFIQFVTRYSTMSGEKRLRVTSVLLPVAPISASPQYFAQGATFDQTCAATVLARVAVHAMERHPTQWEQIRRALDEVLIAFVTRFGHYTMGNPESVQLDPSISLFPIFLFYLRRSEYFMVLNISPDETTFKRHWLLREPVERAVLMLQPTLYSYDFETPSATPVQLDSSSLRADNIVLMDAFFNMHIMWGANIYEWIKAGYHENPEYEYFADLLSAAENDAQMLLSQRFPYPRFSRTDANGSEARHIKTRVNPAHTYTSGSTEYYSAPSMGAETADVINTDDANIAKFMGLLKRAVTMDDSKDKKGILTTAVAAVQK